MIGNIILVIISQNSEISISFFECENQALSIVLGFKISAQHTNQELAYVKLFLKVSS